MTINVSLVDYHNSRQAQLLIELLDSYAQDPMGGGEPLSANVKQNLIDKLQELPYAFSFICYQDEKPVGLVNCIEGFSTFACKPVLNIHDLVVVSQARGQGICDKMLSFVEQWAKERGVCKLTMEVLEGNTVAQKAYIKAGFSGYELDPKMGKAMFWEKKIK